MTEQVKSVDVLNSPAGIEVMGIDTDACLFHGVTTGEMHFSGLSRVTSMEVKGEVFCDKEVIPFTKDIIISRLKYFDKGIFDKLQVLMLEYMTAIKRSEEKLKHAKAAFREARQLLAE